MRFLAEQKIHEGATIAVEIHPAGTVLAATGIDGTISYLDAETLEIIHQYNVGASWLNCLKFTRNGETPRYRK